MGWIVSPTSRILQNIITHHTRFTTDIVKLAAPLQAAKYNLYYHTNDHATHLALVDCFDNALHLEIEEHLPDNPTFHIVWMMLVQIIQSDLMGQFTQMTNEIKQQTPQMYASQNIAEMALAISTRTTALSTAGLYDLQLNGTILKAFLLADGNDEYWFELMMMQSQLTDALKQARFMADKHAASAFLTNLGLGHTQLCALAEGKYREAVGDGIWLPVTNMMDSKVAPSGYYTAAQLNALVQEFGSGKGNSGTSQHDKSQDVCHYCGETGHWAKDCPKKARDLAAGRLSGGGRSGRGSGGGRSHGKDDRRGCGCGHHTGHGGGRNSRSGARRELAPWKLEAPKPRQPETRQKPGRRMDEPSIGVPS